MSETIIIDKHGTAKLTYNGAFIKVSWRTPVGRIQQLYVPRELRGKGLGRALLEIAEEILRLAGVRIVTVSSLVGVERFWEKMGYEQTGTRFYIKILT